MWSYKLRQTIRHDYTAITRAISAVIWITMALSCDTRSKSVHIEGDVFVVITEGEITPNEVVQSQFGIYLQTPEGKYQVHLSDSTKLVEVENVSQIFQGGRYSVKGVPYTPNTEIIEVPSRGGEFLGFIRASEVRKLESQ